MTHQSSLRLFLLCMLCAFSCREIAPVVKHEALINPPFKSADIPYEIFLVNSTKDTTLRHFTGSEIYIPQHAFKDASGNIITRPVEIKYREFHDAVDVFLSGIPMNYDSAGESFVLQTAGMFEILAFSEGQPVFPNPESLISVHLVSDETTMPYNSYFLDTTKQEWQYISTDSASPAPVKVNAIANETAQVEKSNSNDSAFIFNIDFKKEEFPELAVFESVQFKVAADEKNFSPSLAGKIWEDIKLERQKDNNGYLVTFFSEEEQFTFKASPLFSEKDPQKIKDLHETLIAGYEKLLSEKIVTETQRQQIIDSLKNMRISEASAYNQGTTLLNIQLSAAAENEAKIQRTFQILKFGIYNCDMIAKMPTEKQVVAECIERTGGKKLVFPHFALIEKNKKAVYNYSPGNMSAFRFNPSAKNAVLCATDEKTLAYLSVEDFEKGYHKKDTSILITEPDTIIFKMHTVAISPAEKNTSLKIKSLLKI